MSCQVSLTMTSGLERVRKKKSQEAEERRTVAGAVNNSSLSGFTSSCSRRTLMPRLDLKTMRWIRTKAGFNRYWPLWEKEPELYLCFWGCVIYKLKKTNKHYAAGWMGNPWPSPVRRVDVKSCIGNWETGFLSGDDNFYDTFNNCVHMLCISMCTSNGVKVAALWLLHTQRQAEELPISLTS